MCVAAVRNNPSVQRGSGWVGGEALEVEEEEGAEKRSEVTTGTDEVSTLSLSRF